MGMDSSCAVVISDKVGNTTKCEVVMYDIAPILGTLSYSPNVPTQ